MSKSQPLERLEWVKRDTLKPNLYNPNHVARPELRLLKISILEDGWTQPIVALDDYTIVDGYHRWTIAADPEIAALTGGMVPVVRLPLDPIHRMMSTIRHNRARGHHAVLKMAEIVQTMIRDGVELNEIQDRLSMEDEEVIRLADRAGMPLRTVKKGGKAGKAWIPVKGA